MESVPRQDEGNLGPLMLALSWTLAAIAIIIVVLRVLTRLKRDHGLRIDDHFMILSLVCGVINMSLISIAVSWGFGRHLTSLDPTRSIQALKYNDIQQPFHVMSSCFGRISFALFLVEIIQKFITRRRFLYSLMALQFAINGSTAIIILVQCRPIQALWNHQVDGDCWDPRVQEYYSFFQGSFNIITDFILAVFPATFIWQLNMKLRKKIGLIFVMGLGIFSMVATTIKVVQIKSLAAKSDYTYATAWLMIWTSVEQYVIIIAASIPIIVPILRWIGEKLSGYRYVIASWTVLNRKTETAELGRSSQPGQRSSKKNPDTLSEEYILPIYILGSGKDLTAVTVLESAPTVKSLSTSPTRAVQR